MTDAVGFLVVGLFALGMGLAFFVADPYSPTSRAFSLFFAAIGANILLNIPARRSMEDSPEFWIRLFSLSEGVIIFAGYEWVFRLVRTGVVHRNSDGGEPLIRTAQALGCLYALDGVIFPGVRQEVWQVTPSLQLLLRPEYYLFAAPIGLATVLAGFRLMQALRWLDPAEGVRMIAGVIASPFLSSDLFLPWEWKPVGLAIGLIIFLVGAIRYHVVQGQRGQFLARFLSPELARLVRDRGFATALQQSRSEISVFACDLRGFSAFAEIAQPEEVMRLLQDYHSTVGDVVGRHGGSIKDFAGDGVLALVGAPIAREDHAARALAIALEVRVRAEPIFVRWRSLGLNVGIGMGVASGFVTVGTIGSDDRLEYAAVGPAVNLASRLCARAEAGQVLADSRSVGLAREGGIDVHAETLGPFELKGFARPVTAFVVHGRTAGGSPSQGP